MSSINQVTEVVWKPTLAFAREGGPSEAMPDINTRSLRLHNETAIRWKNGSGARTDTKPITIQKDHCVYCNIHLVATKE